MKPDKRLIGTYTPIVNEVEARQAADVYEKLGWLLTMPFDTQMKLGSFPMVISHVADEQEFGFFGEKDYHDSFTDTLLPLADLLAMEPEGSPILKALNDLYEKYPYKKPGDRESYSEYRQGMADGIELCIQEVERALNIKQISK